MFYLDKSKQRGVLFAYSIDYHYREDYALAKLQGLDPNKLYKVTEIMPNKNNKTGKYIYGYNNNGAILSGDMLMKYGLKLNILNRNQSVVLEVTAVE